MVLPPEEPDFGPWNVLSLKLFKQALQRELPKNLEGPSAVAIDGRGGNGKSTFAKILQKMFSGSVVVHTDDIPSSGNWRVSANASVHPSLFDWTERLLANVLEPARAGQPVRYRPSAWDDWGRARDNAIEVPSGCPMLILEGVGAARRELMHLIDLVVWVQADVERAQERGIVRDGDDAGARALWETWNIQEFPFLAEQRPWKRADFVVSGMPEVKYDAATEIVVSASFQYSRVSHTS